MDRTLNIGLAWHSDRNTNLGVGALTVGNIALADAAARRAGVVPAYHLFQPRDAAEPYVTAIAARHELTQRYLWSPQGFARDVARLDLMLDIGAGDSFTDIYPLKRFLMLIGTKYLGTGAGVPLILSPQTIGPFTRQPQSWLAAAMMRRAEIVFARDTASLEAARKLAPEADNRLAVDVAFALPFTRAAKGPGTRVGINVSGLLYGGGYTGRNEFGVTIDYREFTHALVEAMLARPGVTVELISHATSRDMPEDDDARAVEKVAAAFPAARAIAPFPSPSAAKSHISGLDFLVGARMHATIAAYSSGVPVVPVSYSRKFEGLFGSLSYPWLVPVKGMTTEEALAFTLDAFDRRAELAADIGRGQARIEEGLEAYVAALAGQFTRILDKRT